VREVFSKKKLNFRKKYLRIMCFPERKEKKPLYFLLYSLVARMLQHKEA